MAAAGDRYARKQRHVETRGSMETSGADAAEDVTLGGGTASADGDERAAGQQKAESEAGGRKRQTRPVGSEIHS